MFKQYMQENYDAEELKNIAENGCISGAAGTLIYYHETSEVYDKYEDSLWEILEDMADAHGCDSVLGLLYSFRGSKDVDRNATFKNFVVWVCAEKIAYDLTLELEDE